MKLTYRPSAASAIDFQLRRRLARIDSRELRHSSLRFHAMFHA
jgi:hypothetical protein